MSVLTLVIVFVVIVIVINRFLTIANYFDSNLNPFSSIQNDNVIDVAMQVNNNIDKQEDEIGAVNSNDMKIDTVDSTHNYI